MSNESNTTATGPNQKEQFKLAKEAIHHVLNAIADDPRKFWLMGNGTGSWEKLTSAHAAIWDRPVEEVCKDFQPDESNYRDHCEKMKADERLLEYCRENNITAEREED